MHAYNSLLRPSISVVSESVRRVCLWPVLWRESPSWSRWPFADQSWSIACTARIHTTLKPAHAHGCVMCNSIATCATESSRVQVLVKRQCRWRAGNCPTRQHPYSCPLCTTTVKAFTLPYWQNFTYHIHLLWWKDSIKSMCMSRFYEQYAHHYTHAVDALCVEGHG